MKKLYTLILSATLFTATKAQLSLTKSFNEPVIGNTVTTQGFDSTSTAAIPKNTGASQTWNFSAFTSNTVVTTTTYTTVLSTPNATDFPTATIASDDGSGLINYFQSTTATFEFNGIADVGNGIVISFTNNAIVAQWPIAFNYSVTDVFAGTVNSPIGNGPANGTITTSAPGNGVIMLPGSQTFSNVLQVKAVNNIKATVGTFPASATITIVGTDYTYYSSAQKFPLLTNSYSKQTITPSFGSPTITATASVKINTAVYSGVNEFTLDNAYSVYPNPTTGIFTVELANPKSENISVEIMNQLGQIIRKEELGNSAVKTSVNMQGISPGVYFVRTNLGSKSSVKKLILSN